MPPKTRKNITEDSLSANHSPNVGAHRVPGIYGSSTRSDLSRAETFISSSVDLEAAAVLFDSREEVSFTPTVVAEIVPELVSATAVPERMGDELPGYVKDEPDNRSRRRVYLGLVAALVIVAVAVGVYFAVTNNPPVESPASSPTYNSSVYSPTYTESPVYSPTYTESPAYAPTFASPTSPINATSGGEQCEDIQGWYDSDGPEYDCAYYAENDACEFAADYENNGYTANEACCFCGGGE
jgi:hypothetical protein